MELPPHFWVALWQIVIVDVLLSGDNAVVIALACRNLPERYRNRAVIAGTGGAVGVRVLFCFIISWLLRIPALKLVGGSLLLWIGIKLMLPEQEEESDGIKGESNLWGAIRTIIVADVVMSLDNVIGIVAAAKGYMLLVVFGLALSIPLIVFGSRLVLKVMNVFPSLVIAGAALLGWLAGEIMVSDPLVYEWLPGLDERIAERLKEMVPELPNLLPKVALHPVHYIAAIVGAAFVIAVGMPLRRRATEHRPLEDLRVEDSK